MIHCRYLRHRRYPRLRHSTRFKSWLNKQSTRLQMTSEELFNKMKAESLTAIQVEQLKTPEPVEPTDPPAEG